ncbi:transcriptional repressor CTCF-like [Oppia nitens]|uniref:transcriptional repressor CTCF-like n=1 Tax=Oppia nitens TaxID=1686743 RepID=UPI0023DA8C82|nr:transcriptional repressor CTCF-like [Oppia nitens]
MAENPETITDIQNYLQSFNKEIDESGSNETTFYAIDANKLAAGIDEGTLQMLAEQAASGQAGTSGTGPDGAYQTVAIVPDQENGGYVLIVQQPTTSDATEPTITTPTTIQTAVPTKPAISSSTATTKSTPKTSNKMQTRMKRIKQEKKDSSERPNDISVYDFDDINLPNVPEDESINDLENTDQLLNDEEGDESGDVKPNLQKTPKRTKKSPAANVSAKKVKPQTTTTPANPNQHMCNYCNYTSNKRYLLSRHMKSHSEERPHKCGICERGFKTIASLQNHVNTHTGVRPHGCKYCEAAFTTSGELVRHVRYRHTHEKPHRCTECDYASVELSKLKRHMRCHTGERPYQCPHCTYASPDTYKLKRHLRIHTGEKPYECDVCHARFTQSNSLKAHRLIHSGNKPIFKCELCPTTCGRKTDLRIHVQKLHTSDKLLSCKRCDQSFPDRYHFKLHLKTHEGEKCFKCDLCNYASVSARHLESHMLIHTDQKPFNCDLCDQSFRQKQLLKRHKNLYHNPAYVAPQPKEKTHECPQCNKAFRHKGNLMRHMQIHDPDAYKEQNINYNRMNDSTQLIDDEDEDDMEDSSQMIVPNESDEEHTLSFTLDPQTQQILQNTNGEQVVVFEVVQMPNNDNDSTTLPDEGQLVTEQLNLLQASTSKGKGKTRYAIARQNGANNSNDNYIIQLSTEDAEAANAIQDDSIIDDPDYMPKHSVRLSSAPTTSSGLISQPTSIPPPPLVTDDTKQLRDQIQKQKDLANCFGFKDDDEEDDAILSMPAVHGQ